MWFPSLLFLALLPLSASAGEYLRYSASADIYLNDCGLWNSPEDGRGVSLLDGFPVAPFDPGLQSDISFGGAQSNRIVVRWLEEGVAMEVVADTVTETCEWTTEANTGHESFPAYQGRSSGLVMRKGERRGSGVDFFSTDYMNTHGIGFEFENVGETVITELQVLHVSNPELDWEVSQSVDTINDTYDTADWGFNNWAIALAQESSLTMGYYACSDEESVGFLPEGADAGSALLDPNGEVEDLELAWRSGQRSLQPGETTLFVMATGISGGRFQARDYGRLPFGDFSFVDRYALRLEHTSQLRGCTTVDTDQDGLMHPDIGGLDCDDGDAEVGRAPRYWRDNDRDGYGDPDDSFTSCMLPTNAVVAGGEPDCNDSAIAINPGAVEQCDGIDNDCNDDVDDGLTVNTFYEDLDADGFGDPNVSEETCEDGVEGFVSNADDCDPGDRAIHPNADEVAGNSIDEDCDDSWDCYEDADSDSFGTSAVVASDNNVCTDDGESPNTLDCDDTDGTVNPDGMDTAGGSVDADCDGELTCYIDEDGDGFGNASGGTWTVQGESCDDIDTASSNAEDCNDSEPTVSPNADEIAGNDVDEDCDASWECFEDADGDGYAADGAGTVLSDNADCDDAGEADVFGDCDDTDAGVNPAADEIEDNGVDEDCDGVAAQSDDVDTEVDTETDTEADSDTEVDEFTQGGCDCDSGGQGAGWLVLGLLPLLVRRRRSLRA